jgi:hypothetical protein
MDERRRATSALAALVAAAALLRLYFAWRYPGFLTGDDLETIETAGKYSLGLRYTVWDIRSLFHPLAFLWAPLAAASCLGVRDPRALTWIASLPAVAFSSATAALVYLLARRSQAPRRTAAVAAALYAFHFLPLAFGSTAYPRPVSTALLTLAFLLVSGERPARLEALAAGALAGAAFAVRWSEGVVLLPLLGWAAWKNRGRRLGVPLLAGFAASTLLFVGVLDAITWGRPFASLWAFFRQMYLEIPVVRLAEEKPFTSYAVNVLQWAGPVALVLLFAAWPDRRSRAPLAVFVSIIALLSLFAHKEWRYLQAAIPLLCVAAAFGWEQVRARFGAVAAVVALVLGCGWGIERADALLAKKSQAALAAAHWMRTLQPPPRVIALEQSWAYGDRLYLGNDVTIREIEWQRRLTRLAMREAANGADLVAVWVEHLDAAAAAEIRERGFVEAARFRKDSGRECVVFLSPERNQKFQGR